MKKRVSKLCTFEQQHTFIDLESSFHHCNYEDLESREVRRGRKSWNVKQCSKRRIRGGLESIFQGNIFVIKRHSFYQCKQLKRAHSIVPSSSRDSCRRRLFCVGRE